MRKTMRFVLWSQRKARQERRRPQADGGGKGMLKKS